MSFNVGDKVTLEGEDAEQLSAAQDSIRVLQENLGSLRADFLIEEAPLLTQINELKRTLGTLTEEYRAKEALLTGGLETTRFAYHELLVSVGVRLGAKLNSTEEKWRWDPDQLTFERVK